MSPTRPTAFPDLNAVLDDFVAGVKAILEENFCGAYLQGSFAVGDADVHSDVDFIVVTREEVNGEQAVALQAMHQRIYALDTPWAQHLEGSYAPKELLRRVDPSRSPFPYLDNGATRLIWDNHCNTAVVRWSLHEYGVVLAGPDPRSLLETVSPEQLRAEIASVVQEWVDWAKAPEMSGWRQPTIVLSFCRMLHTLETGRVTSKREAGEWALATLDPAWRRIVSRAPSRVTRVPLGTPSRAIGKSSTARTSPIFAGECVVTRTNHGSARNVICDPTRETSSAASSASSERLCKIRRAPARARSHARATTQPRRRASPPSARPRSRRGPGVRRRRTAPGRRRGARAASRGPRSSCSRPSPWRGSRAAFAA
jgi:hypothetical protein